MRKIVGILVALVFVAGMAVPGYAAKAGSKKESAAYDRIVADVVSLDVAGKSMVVKEEKTGATRTIKISAKAAAGIKVGDRVRVKLHAGTNESAGVRVLKGQSAAEPAAEPVEPVKK